MLQERYGYAREQAEQEIDRRLQEYGDKTGRVVARHTYHITGETPWKDPRPPLRLIVPALGIRISTTVDFSSSRTGIDNSAGAAI